jgi:hypothetical protein
MKSSIVALSVLLSACSDPSISSSTGGDGAGASRGGGLGGSSGGAGKGGGGSGATGTGGSTGAGGSSSMGPNPGDKNCGLQTFKLEKRPAELMLVLDRSGSMNMPAGAGSMNSKWTDVTAALDETIMKTETTVQWGLKAFPSGDVMCNVSDGVEVPSAPMNHGPVWGQIMANAPAAGNGAGGGTPTTLALQKAVAYLDGHTSQNPRYLVLATDGEPNCGAGGQRRGNQGSDAPAAIMAVAAAQKAGYKTFVIGIATSGEADVTLSQMATAGGEPRMATPPYYPVANRQDLINALGVITGLVTDCVFHLGQPPPSPDDVAVNVGTTRVSRDAAHANGWDYGAGNRTIQFYGAACEQVKKAQGQNVQIIFGCPGVIIQ